MFPKKSLNKISNRKINRKINRLYERFLRIICNDKQSSFKILLEKNSSGSIHDRNIQCLATEMCHPCHPYSVQLYSQFSRPLVRSIFHGIESITYLGRVIWDILPDSHKNLPNFSVFKNKIKKWKPESCPCRHPFLDLALHRLSLR